MELNKFVELGALTLPQEKVVEIKNNTLNIKQYLPIEQKAEMIQYVIDNAINPGVGGCSPIRAEMFFYLGVLKYYCGFAIEGENLAELYDLCEANGVLEQVWNHIPEKERNFITTKTDETIEAVSKYSTSFVGVLQSMAADSDTLDSNLQDILQGIKSKEGIELIDQIKNAVGSD